jgi:hypothetical protein
MWRFLKRMRRTIGVLMLMMALLAMVGWVTNMIGFECSFSYGGVFTTHTVFSEGHSIGYQYSYEQYSLSHSKAVETDWEISTLSDDNSEIPSSDSAELEEEANDDLQTDDPTDERQVAVEIQHVRLVEVPYWSIVIAMMVLSAWLLLLKPKQSSQKKTVEAVPDEGT